MTINIEYEAEEKLDLDYEKIINEVVNEAAAYEKCPYEIEVNVTLTDNEAIHQINKEFREVDAPTDVLSFPIPPVKFFLVLSVLIFLISFYNLLYKRVSYYIVVSKLYKTYLINL